MDADYGILEEELKNLITHLKQKLHMRGIETLARKHRGVAEKALQRKLIMHLEHEIEDLETAVSRIYNPQNAIKDHQIKGYLIYLLRLKDVFSREIQTKKEIIKQREEQISALLVKMCSLRNEYFRRKRNEPKMSDEFTLLDNMTDRMDRLGKRISGVQNENRELREGILATRAFQSTYKRYVKRFRKQIQAMAAQAQSVLDRAVMAYENREYYANKIKLYEERCAQDIRKSAINENALNLVLEKNRKYEAFQELQNKTRTDARIEIARDLIEQGLTGLEPLLEGARGLQQTITDVSGGETPDQIEDFFQRTESDTSATFQHLEELLKGMHHTQNVLDELGEKNKSLLKKMTANERKMRWKIQNNQTEVDAETEAAEKISVEKTDARSQLDALLERVSHLYGNCNSLDEKLGLPEREVDPLKVVEIDYSNAVDFTEAIEKRILEYLMLTEYKEMKEAPEEEFSAKLGKSEDDVEDLADAPPSHHLDVIVPRTLRSETELDCLIPLEEQDSFLQLEDLKKYAAAAVTQIESPPPESSEGEEASTNPKE